MSSATTHTQQECIPVGCIPPTCCLYLPACTAPRGCTCPGGVYPPRGVYLPMGLPARGVLAQGGVPAPGGCTCPGGCTWPRCMLAYTPPVNRMTDRCKNITLPQTSFADGNNNKSRWYFNCNNVRKHHRQLSLKTWSNNQILTSRLKILHIILT